MISKNIKIGNDWKRVTLMEEEVNKVIEESIENNLKILSKCMDMAENKEIAEKIFEKCGIPTFVLLKEKLEDKCAEMRRK